MDTRFMPAQLIDGKSLATEIRAEIATLITEHKQQGFRQPGLAVILVGDDPASAIYVRNKRQACEEVGIESIHHHLPSDIHENELIKIIQDLNNAVTVDGILLQLPLPGHIDDNKVLESIVPHKDVDGFH